MPILRFLSQQELVTWADDGKIDVQGDKVLVPGEPAGYHIREAVRFMKLVSGDDATGLLAKVKTTEQLKSLGAEHYLDSVILGETAYEVLQGYVAEPLGADKAQAPAASPSPGNRDANALADFIIGKLG